MEMRQGFFGIRLSNSSEPRSAKIKHGLGWEIVDMEVAALPTGTPQDTKMPFVLCRCKLRMNAAVAMCSPTSSSAAATP